jgi:hypothetical protein
MENQRGSIMAEITADLSASIGAGRDTIILQAIRDADRTNDAIAKAIGNRSVARTPEFAEAIRHRGRFEIYPDKTETFFWDGKPLIHFMPMEIKQEGGKITASQPYRVVEGHEK